MTGQQTLARAAILSALLALGKFAAGLGSGSLTVMASAADSFADAFMSTVNWWGHRHARTPADDDHPYGHGKFEGAVAVGQGMLLLGITVSLVATAIKTLVEGDEVRDLGIAVWTLALSGAFSGVLALLLHRARDGSVVVEADAAHYRVDVLTALAGVGGLLAAKATALPWIDPALCMVLALLMAREAYGVLRLGAAEILDEALPEEEVDTIRAILASNASRVVDCHGLRTRRSGPLKFVEVHVLFPSTAPMGGVHEVVQDIGDQIRAAIPGSRVLVHPDAEGHNDRVDDSLEAQAPQ